MRADVVTRLPLDTYAKMMGIAPLHFNRLRLPDVSPEPFSASAGNAAQPLWYQFDWQATGQVSIDTLARTIADAERSIEGFLGYNVAPAWTSQEVHTYPHEYRPELYGNGLDVRGQMKAIRPKKGRIIAAGRRTVSLIATAAGATLVYSDPNSDGWNTLATITIATTLTDVNQIKIYFAGHSGDPKWEIRPVKSKAISGGNVVITVDSWLLVDPDLQNAIPTDEKTAINASTAATYVTSVEVRREYTDFTQASAEFFWERKPKTNKMFCSSCSGNGCEACTLITQDGCWHPRGDVYAGLIAPAPADYNATTEIWDRADWSECREPDIVKVWYYSGEQSEQYLRGEVTDPLDERLARAVTLIATARLTCNFRSRNNVADMVEFWRRDVAESGESVNTIFTPPSVLSNPFGTRRGEVEAWKMLNFNTERRAKVAIMAG